MAALAIIGIVKMDIEAINMFSEEQLRVMLKHMNVFIIQSVKFFMVRINCQRNNLTLAFLE